MKKDKTNNIRQDRYMDKLKVDGFKKSTVVAHIEDWPKIRGLEKKLKKQRGK